MVNFDHPGAAIPHIIGVSSSILFDIVTEMKEQRMQQRRRIKHKKPFKERLAEVAKRFREAADKLPPGHAQEMLLQRARQAETASHINEWVRSPGRQAPKSLESLLADEK